jgi:pyruvate formate lyase activating enzyme
VKSTKESNSPVIACTYAEPVIFYEYMIDIAKVARKNNIRTVMVSAGLINSDPLKELCKHLDAIKIDLKAFTEKFYKDICNSELKPVLKTLEVIKNSGIWLEIVYLVIPTLNDDEKSIREMCLWIKRNLGENVPIHFTRFYPQYRLKNLTPTPIGTLEKLRNIAISSGLRYVYTGNIPGSPGENSYCYKCKKVIIRRTGYFVEENNIVGGKCKFCKEKIPGVWL